MTATHTARVLDLAVDELLLHRRGTGIADLGPVRRRADDVVLAYRHAVENALSAPALTRPLWFAVARHHVDTLRRLTRSPGDTVPPSEDGAPHARLSRQAGSEVQKRAATLGNRTQTYA